MSASFAASSSSPSIAIVAPCNASSARSTPQTRPVGGTRRPVSRRPSPARAPRRRAARSCGSSPGPHTAAARGERRDDIVGDGQEHELDVVDHGVRLGEGADARDELPEPFTTAGSRDATAATGQPRAAQCHPEGSPHRPLGAPLDREHRGARARVHRELAAAAASSPHRRARPLARRLIRSSARRSCSATTTSRSRSSRPTESSPLYRNATGDELVYVHERRSACSSRCSGAWPSTRRLRRRSRAARRISGCSTRPVEL